MAHHNLCNKHAQTRSPVNLLSSSVAGYKSPGPTPTPAAELCKNLYRLRDGTVFTSLFFVNPLVTSSACVARSENRKKLRRERKVLFSEVVQYSACELALGHSCRAFCMTVWLLHLLAMYKPFIDSQILIKLLELAAYLVIMVSVKATSVSNVIRRYLGNIAGLSPVFANSQRIQLQKLSLLK